MNIFINYEADKPMYEQIEEKIKEEIHEKRAGDNELLPSVRQLCADLNVSAITVKRAYADLEREGYVYTIAGKGTFVRLKDFDSLVQKRKEEKLEECLEMFKTMKKTGIEKSEIIKLLDEVFHNT